MIYCPTCGAELMFDISSQTMLCNYCRNHFEPASLKNNSADDALTQPYYDSYAYVCPSCGAEVDTTDKNDAVGFCPYCKGSSMIFDQLRRDWKPDGIIPFQITKRQCKEMYAAEVKKYFFVSRKYSDPELIEGFRGIYMPYCHFTGVVDGMITMRGFTKEISIGNYDYRTDYYDIKGNAHYDVTKAIAHDASSAFDDHISERLGRFDEKIMKEFHPAYLSGFYAESGNADMEEYAAVEQEEMLPFIRNTIKEDRAMKKAADVLELTIDPDYGQNVVPIKMVTSNRRLFPVWFMSYRRGKKITYAAVNGQTGQVAADLPLSPLKILLTALVFSAVIFGLLFLLMYFLPTIPAAATLGVCTMLGFSGMYVLQHGYIRTVGSALHQKEMNKGLPVGFIIQSILATIAIILMTTDGTFEQRRYVFGVGLFALTMLVLFLYYFLNQTTMAGKISKLQLTTLSMQSNGILVAAKRFSRINAVFRLVMFLTLVAFIPFIVMNNFPNAFYYILAAVAATELFVLTLFHVMFQSHIAQRRLPQFNKKGAAYDKI